MNTHLLNFLDGGRRGHGVVATSAGVAAKETVVIDGSTRALTLDLGCLLSETWMTLKPSYLVDLVLLLTAVVSRGTLVLRKLATANRDVEASIWRAFPCSGSAAEVDWELAGSEIISDSLEPRGSISQVPFSINSVSYNK